MFSRQYVNTFWAICILLDNTVLYLQDINSVGRKSVVPNETYENTACYKMQVTVKTTKLIEISNAVVVWFEVFFSLFALRILQQISYRHFSLTYAVAEETSEITEKYFDMA